LRAYCAEIARVKRKAFRDETYWGRPVPGFGDPAARVLLIGLAPAAHGANRTGRVFTGDLPTIPSEIVRVSSGQLRADESAGYHETPLEQRPSMSRGKAHCATAANSGDKRDRG
jgi:hypothetical protein